MSDILRFHSGESLILDFDWMPVLVIAWIISFQNWQNFSFDDVLNWAQLLTNLSFLMSVCPSPPEFLFRYKLYRRWSNMTFLQSLFMHFVHPWNTLEQSKEKCHPCEWKSISPSRPKSPCFAKENHSRYQSQMFSVLWSLPASITFRGRWAVTKSQDHRIRDLRDHLVQPFLAKAWPGKKGPAES